MVLRCRTSPSSRRQTSTTRSPVRESSERVVPSGPRPISASDGSAVAESCRVRSATRRALDRRPRTSAYWYRPTQAVRAGTCRSSRPRAHRGPLRRTRSLASWDTYSLRSSPMMASTCFSCGRTSRAWGAAMTCWSSDRGPFVERLGRRCRICGDQEEASSRSRTWPRGSVVKPNTAGNLSCHNSPGRRRLRRARSPTPHAHARHRSASSSLSIDRSPDE